jgi:hypothetical protein
MKTETYCIYCHHSEKEIRAENKRAGYRMPCLVRDTKKGFHKFGLRCSECKKNWRECKCNN